MCNIWGLRWPSIPFPQDILFPRESGLGTPKTPPQFAGVAGERTATFWQLKRRWRRLPRAPDQQERTVPLGAAAGDARVIRVGCGRQPLPAALAPSPALFLGLSVLRIIVKLSGCLGVPTLRRCCKPHSVSLYHSALAASQPSSGSVLV